MAGMWMTWGCILIAICISTILPNTTAVIMPSQHKGNDFARFSLNERIQDDVENGHLRGSNDVYKGGIPNMLNFLTMDEKRFDDIEMDRLHNDDNDETKLTITDSVINNNEDIMSRIAAWKEDIKIGNFNLNICKTLRINKL